MSGVPISAEPAVAATPAALDPQSDEGAGKGADVAKIGVSPKKGSPYLGSREPLVIVNVFADFQCPVCRRSADPVKQLVLDFPGKVKVVFRNYALAMHGRSKPAAIAAAAARKQGKFWQYYDKLFSNSSALDDTALRWCAHDLKLDLAEWDRDIADPAIAARVKDETSWAAKLTADAGTPSFFINGVRQIGWGSYRGLKLLVQRELSEAEALQARGTRPDQIVRARIKAMAEKNTRREREGPIEADVWVKLLTAE